MRAYLTRDDDYFVPLHVRVHAPRARRPVRVHPRRRLDQAVRQRFVGVRAVPAAPPTRRRAGWPKENAADLIGGVNLGSHDRQVAKVLLDLSTTAQINDSLKVGNSFLDEIKKINRLHKNSVEQAGFAVLKAPDIPSILVETAFISNPQKKRCYAAPRTRTSWRRP